MKSSLNMLMLTMAVAAAGGAITMQNEDAFPSPEKKDHFSSSAKSVPVKAPVKSTDSPNPLSQSIGGTTRGSDVTSRPQKASTKTTAEDANKKGVTQEPRVTSSSDDEAAVTSNRPSKASTKAAVKDSSEKNVSQEPSVVQSDDETTTTNDKMQKNSLKISAGKNKKEGEQPQSSPVTKQSPTDKKSPTSQSPKSTDSGIDDLDIDLDIAALESKLGELKQEVLHKEGGSEVEDFNLDPRLKDLLGQQSVSDHQSGSDAEIDRIMKGIKNGNQDIIIDDFENDEEESFNVDNIDDFIKRQQDSEHPTDEAERVFNGSNKSLGLASDEAEEDSKEPTSRKKVVFNSEVKTKNGKAALGAGGGELPEVEEEEEESEVNFTDIQMDLQAEEEDGEFEEETNAKPRININFEEEEERVLSGDAFPDEKTDNLSKKDKQFFVPTRDSVTDNKKSCDDEKILSEGSLRDENEVNSTISIKSSKRSNTNIDDHQNQNRRSNKFSPELGDQANADKEMLSEGSLRDENDENVISPTASPKSSKRPSVKSDRDIEDFSNHNRRGSEFAPGVNDQIDDNNNDNKIDLKISQFDLDFSSAAGGRAQNFDDDFDLEGAFESIFGKRKKGGYSQMAEDWRNLNEELNENRLSLYLRVNRQLRNEIPSEKGELGQEILLLLSVNRGEELAENMMQMMKEIGVFGEQRGSVSDLPGAMGYVAERFNRMASELQSINELFSTPDENKDGNENEGEDENENRGEEEEESLVLSELVSHMKKEFEKSRQRLSELESSSSQLSETLKSKESEISELKAQLLGNSTASPKLSKKSEQVEMETEDLISEYQRQVQDLRDKNLALKEKLRKGDDLITQQLEAQEKEIKELTLRKEKAEKDLTNTQKALEENKSLLRGHLKTRQLDEESRQQEMQAEVQKVKDEAALFKKHYKVKAQKWDVEKNDLLAAIEEQKSQVEEEQRNIRVLRYQLERANSGRRLAEKDLEASQNREKLVSDQLKKSENKRARLKEKAMNEIESLRSQLQQAQSEKELVMKDVESVRESYEAKIDSLHERLQQFQIERVQLLNSQDGADLSPQRENQREMRMRFVQQTPYPNDFLRNTRDSVTLSDMPQFQGGEVSFSATDESALRRVIRSGGKGYDAERGVFTPSQMDVSDDLKDKLREAARANQVIFSHEGKSITAVDK